MAGDTLLLGNGSTATLAGTYSRRDEIRVFNFEVSGTHTYTVGTSAVLVHNAKGCGKLFNGFGRNVRTGKGAVDDAAKALKIDRNVIRERIHQIKRDGRLGGADHVGIDIKSGRVYNGRTGEHIGDLLD